MILGRGTHYSWLAFVITGRRATVTELTMQDPIRTFTLLNLQQPTMRMRSHQEKNQQQHH